MNLILDSVEGIRGLGEIDRFYRPRRGYVQPCVLCQPTDDDAGRHCTFYDRAPPSRFFGACFERYLDAHVLVDASKDPRSYRVAAREPNLAFVRLYLAKYPHEYAESCERHDRRSARAAFAEWIKVYNEFLGAGIPAPSACVSYRAFAREPAETAKRIASLCGIAYPRVRGDWWNTRTHVIGGNTAAKAQVSAAYRHQLDADAKYHGQHHRVFVDACWRENAALVRACRDAYATFARELEPLLRRLWLPTVDELVSDLGAPSATGASPST